MILNDKIWKKAATPLSMDVRYVPNGAEIVCKHCSNPHDVIFRGMGPCEGCKGKVVFPVKDNMQVTQKVIDKLPWISPLEAIQNKTDTLYVIWEQINPTYRYYLISVDQNKCIRGLINIKCKDKNTAYEMVDILIFMQTMLTKHNFKPKKPFKV